MIADQQGQPDDPRPADGGAPSARPGSDPSAGTAPSARTQAPWEREHAPLTDNRPAAAGDAPLAGQRARWNSGGPAPQQGPAQGRPPGPPPGHRPQGAPGAPVSGPPANTRYRMPGQQQRPPQPPGRRPLPPRAAPPHPGPPQPGRGPNDLNQPGRGPNDLGRPGSGQYRQARPPQGGPVPQSRPVPQQPPETPHIAHEDASEASPTIERAVAGVSPDLRGDSHYGDSDALGSDHATRDVGDVEEMRVATERARAGRTAPAGNTPAGNTPAAGTNTLSIVALVLSVLGVTAPIGVYLAYTSLRTIRRTGELGAPFAEAAKWLGWLWIAFFVFGAIAYFWIGSQGS